MGEAWEERYHSVIVYPCVYMCVYVTDYINAYNGFTLLSKKDSLKFYLVYSELCIINSITLQLFIALSWQSSNYSETL